ncbi:hypothetical protein PT974_08512 [Cladobotryum mycophilum]|uniref:Autophagy-related protein 101 n=1 Tax=Cladobotryum mycophilum TaxID=491253 RepID=A0ABR0SEX8_9HYPO
MEQLTKKKSGANPRAGAERELSDGGTAPENGERASSDLRPPAHHLIPPPFAKEKQSNGPDEAPEFILDVFTDPRSVREVVKGILHTIFFNRFFPSLTPQTHEVLDLTLPYVNDDELETMIQQRAYALERQLDAERSSAGTAGSGASIGGIGGALSAAGAGLGVGGGGGKAGGIGGGGGDGGSGGEARLPLASLKGGDERLGFQGETRRYAGNAGRSRSPSPSQGQRANEPKSHPSDYHSGGNPFPYKINIEPKETGWAARMRIY